MFNATTASFFARITDLATGSNANSITPNASTQSNLPWHLGAKGIDAASVWADYTGRGVSVGVFDDGVQRNHSALVAEMSDTSMPSTVSSLYGRHGTAVSGLIAANPTSGQAVGVAYGATLTNVDILGLSNESVASTMAQAARFDVVNNSWGFANAYAADIRLSTWQTFSSNIANAVDTGRDGLGTVMVVAAGNSRADGLDTNLSNFQNDRHVITVAAVTSEGGVASYSTPGASVLVAASSGGGVRLGLTTTDRLGSDGYTSGDYTTTFSGTSAATPLVSGTVALMLEANDQLGWRDVRSILAMSANPVMTGATSNGADGWNGGGMVFSNDVGFGLIDARAAVRLAETWLTTNTSADEVSVTGSVSQAQALTDKGTISFRINIQNDISVESAVLRIGGSHTRSSDLEIDLISPDGTVSQILDNVGGEADFTGFTFSSNAFLGENSAGVWTVQIRDTVAGITGSFNSATLSLYGEAPTVDNVYVYTDAFGTLTGSSRSVLADKAGSDVLNASAVSTGSVIDLTPGAVSTIAGRSLQIEYGTVIESAFGGDGNDLIIGNSASNLIYGGRGNDDLRGGAGNDILFGGAGSDKYDGGTGTDLVRLEGNAASWTVSHAGGVLQLSNTVSHESETAVSIEGLLFDDGLMAFDATSDLGMIFRLYEGAFQRAPDLKGLLYWVENLSSGNQNIHTIASLFTSSAEFNSIYGSNGSTEHFLASLYQNTLGREAGAQEIASWMDFGAGHMTRGQLLTSFTESAEAIQITGSAFAHGVFIAGDLV